MKPDEKKFIIARQRTVDDVALRLQRWKQKQTNAYEQRPGGDEDHVHKKGIVCMPNNTKNFKLAAVAAITGALLFTAGCGVSKDPSPSAAAAAPDQTTSPAAGSSTKPEEAAANSNGSSRQSSSVTPTKQPSSSSASATHSPAAIQVVANPGDNAVMVNKSFKLPDGYSPPDLVEPNVPFLFKEHLEKRKMRKDAAAVLETLFAAAKKNGLPLAGVSAYRSYETQKTLYNNYVQKDGQVAADRYSAKPGMSEHQTGLAIDVSGSTGQCAASDCFADTKEAKWLEQHAPEFGFIIRYPKGKESITGYQYEPWHLRYVGKELAKNIASKGLTLEEYLGNTTTVAKPK
jgi:zinc D-Ala-D-Ala carboxypeptidase